MSAIWGSLHYGGKSICKDIGQAVVKRLSVYKIDKSSIWEKDNIHLGCGLQYITPESLNEKLPYYDESRKLAITADAIIDNRQELFNLLGISVSYQKEMTDSELILRSYEKWGLECPKYLVGDFSFAIWNEEKKELFCARDHVGKRTFYYYFSNKTFYFCTVIKPIFEMINRKPKLNERWIADFLALAGVVHSIEYTETIFEEILQLAPANTLVVNEHGITIKKYWDPVKEVRVLKLKSDKEYEEAYRKVLFEAVHCRLRSGSSVGIMLSGGLDSGSIACIAAEELAAEYKNLQAFSSIPIKGYQAQGSKYFITDESEYVKTIEDKYSNIEVEYCRSEGKDSAAGIESFLDLIEEPYKTIENMFWVNSITEKAAKKNCRVLLTGQSGNGTISFGNFDIHIKTLFSRGKLLTINREINGICRLNKIPKNRVRKEVLKVLLPYKLRKFTGSLIKNENKNFQFSPINYELIKKWDIERRFNKIGFNVYPERFYTLNEFRRFIINPVAFSHIAAMETKISLAYGIADRDPTRDKRVIEFCLSLPSEQFVRDGQERYLIRRAMEGILPDKIRLNFDRRGLQSADWIERLRPRWNEIYSYIDKSLKNESILSYIDTGRLKKELESMVNGLKEEKKYYIRMLLVSLVFSKFMEEYHKL